MNCQLPDRFKKEEEELQRKLLSQDSIDDVWEFIDKNASKEYKAYLAKKKKKRRRTVKERHY